MVVSLGAAWKLSYGGDCRQREGVRLEREEEEQRKEENPDGLGSPVSSAPFSRGGIVWWLPELWKLDGNYKGRGQRECERKKRKKGKK